MARLKQSMIEIFGIPVSEGVAIQKALVLKKEEEEELSHLFHEIKSEEVSQELARLDQAYLQAERDLNQLIQELATGKDFESMGIVQAHQVMLRDPKLRSQIEKQIQEGFCNAEYAVAFELRLSRKRIEEKLKDGYFRFWGDFQDLENRLLGIFRGHEVPLLKELREEIILVTGDLTPEQTLSFDLSKIKGVATDFGGPTSHTAIVTKTHRIPAVVGLKTLTQSVRSGDLLIIDGKEGKVIVHPTPKVLKNYTQKQKLQKVAERNLQTYHTLSAETLEGQKIHLFANIESPDEIPVALERGAQGIGLYRTEFLFQEGIPNENTHFAAYEKALKYLKGKPLVIRTIDLGGDKFIKAAGSHRETNPFLGCRSIRLCLQERPDLFLSQLRAILRVAAKYKNVRMMFPMISTLSELQEALQKVEEAKMELRKEQIPFHEKLPVGIMVEIPATAILSDNLAKNVDFFSIGTNDLTQYTLAVDRNNERVAHLYKPYHPAVLRLIKYVIHSAYKHKIEVSMCGEMPTDVSYALLLLGMGLQNFSVNSASIPKIIRALRQVRMRKLIDISCSILQLGYTEDVHRALEEHYNGLLHSESLNSEA